jgi:endoribonuclease L-PSP, putative
MKQAILSPDAPGAIGPYCHAVVHNGLVITSGQIGVDPATGKMVPGGAPEQARQVMTNLGAVLDASGSDFDKVLKATVYLADMADFAGVNAVYAGYFSADNYPARCCVAVKTLPANALVEIELLAAAG